MQVVPGFPPGLAACRDALGRLIVLDLRGSAATPEEPPVDHLHPRSPVAALVASWAALHPRPRPSLDHVERSHLARLRARHDRGECAGVDCPACEFGRALPRPGGG